jgi:YNFM family putative membrane transporter
MLSPTLAAVLAGMVLAGVGTCFVGRAATSDRGSASGLYLAFYFFGGLMGAAVLG